MSPSLGFLTPRRTFSPSGAPIALLKGHTMVSISSFHALSNLTLPWIWPRPSDFGHWMLSLLVLHTQRYYPRHQTWFPKPQLVCRHPCLRPFATLSLVTQSGDRRQWQAQRSPLRRQHLPRQHPRHPHRMTSWTTAAPRLWLPCAVSSANATRTASRLVPCSRTSYPGEVVGIIAHFASIGSKIASK